MKLVVGLGNPGRRYEGTRHNIGYAILAELAESSATACPRRGFTAQVVEADLNGQKALLLSPTTFMNLSGTSVQEAKSFYKLADEDLLVICDDLNLPVGKLRFRARGSSGGQKGLEDIIRRLGTEEFSRLRVGVGTAPEGWDWADYVLSKFTPEELPEMEHAVGVAADAVAVWARVQSFDPGDQNVLAAGIELPRICAFAASAPRMAGSCGMTRTTARRSPCSSRTPSSACLQKGSAGAEVCFLLNRFPPLHCCCSTFTVPLSAS